MVSTHLDPKKSSTWEPSLKKSSPRILTAIWKFIPCLNHHLSKNWGQPGCDEPLIKSHLPNPLRSFISAMKTSHASYSFQIFEYVNLITHRIHVWYIYSTTNGCFFLMVNVGTYYHTWILWVNLTNSVVLVSSMGCNLLLILQA